jgi:hypothetical protein
MQGVLSRSPVYFFTRVLIKLLSVYVYLLLCITIYNVYTYAIEIFGTICMSRDRSVDIVTRLPARRPRNGDSIPSRGIHVSLLRI